MDFGDLHRHQPTAICLVRVDISGSKAPRHALEVQRHAARLGYTSLYTVRPPIDVPDPVGYALGLAASLNVDAMIVYDLETVGHTPSRVCETLDLETVCPPVTWAAAAAGPADSAHAHPEQPLTIASARRIMQQHLNCRTMDCPRKSSAYSYLVRVGKIVPPVDTPRERAAGRGIAYRPRPDEDNPLPEGVSIETLLNVLAGLVDYSPSRNRSGSR